MNRKNLIKLLSIISLIVIVANLLLFAFHIYSDLIFWIIIVAVAIFAFPVLSWLKKRK